MLASKGRSATLLYAFFRKSLQFTDIDYRDKDKVNKEVIFKTVVYSQTNQPVREIETSCDSSFFRILSNWINNTKTFGMELSTIAKRPSSIGGIPAVVAHTTHFIREHGIVEGIFRKSGGIKEIEQIKSNYDEGLIENVSQIDPKTDPNVIAGLLKMFFRNLPTPIITPGLYTKLLELNTDDELECQNQIKILLKELPRTNYIVLHYLCKFLDDISKFSSITLMDISNLSIVFGSNIIRPKTGRVIHLSKLIF